MYSIGWKRIKKKQHKKQSQQKAETEKICLFVQTRTIKQLYLYRYKLLFNWIIHNQTLLWNVFSALV